VDICVTGNVHTINSLLEYGKYLEFQDDFQLTPSVLRCERNGGQEFLRMQLESQLGLVSRLVKFLGIGDFHISKIQRLVVNAFEQMDEITLRHLKQGRRHTYIERTVSLLNEKISEHNNRVLRIWSLIRRIFRMQIIEKIVLPSSLRQAENNSFQLCAKVEDKVNPSDLPGLKNSGNHCYCGSVVQALRASTGFRSQLEALPDKTLVNTTMQVLFAEMEKQVGPSPNGENYIGCRKGSSFDQFKKAAGQFYKPLQYHKQQDAGELFRVVVDVALSRLSVIKNGKVDTESGFIPLQSYIDRTKIDKNDVCLLTKARQADVPPPEALYINSLDHEHRIEMAQKITIEIPENVSLLDLRDFFWGNVNTEQADVSSIIGDENKNNPWLTLEQREAIEKAAIGRNKIVYTIPVVTGVRLAINSPKEAPSWLAIYVPRFTRRRERNGTPVLAPYILSIPTGESSSVSYALKAVVAHVGGRSIRSGHYVALLPKAASRVEGQEMPKIWAYADDDLVTEHTYENVGESIAHNGCIFIYDKVDVEVVTTKLVVSNN
jgi:ubiquitin C-terminal hydrolase